MDSPRLRQFLAVYEVGSIAAAAEVVLLTQPALSKAIKSLEVDLGVERRQIVAGLRELHDAMLTWPDELDVVDKLARQLEMDPVELRRRNLIQPGALHQANGGYLVLRARDLFAQPDNIAARCLNRLGNFFGVALEEALDLYDRSLGLTSLLHGPVVLIGLIFDQPAQFIDLALEVDNLGLFMGT